MGLLQDIQQSSSLMLMIGYLICDHLSLLLLSVYVKYKKPSQKWGGLYPILCQWSDLPANLRLSVSFIGKTGR
jgi:hypothetical protein